MERRFVAKTTRSPVEVRADDNGTKINGLAAVYYDGTPDTEFDLWPGVKERIMPGAFDRAIKEKQDVRGLFNHDPNFVLGRTVNDTLKLRNNKTGLDYEIEPPDTQAARDVQALLKRGDVSGSSFSFRVVSETWHERTEDGGPEIREINDVDMYDVGPVTFPAYEATTSGMRAVGDVDEARVSHDVWAEARADTEAEEVVETEDEPETIDPQANAKLKAARLAELGL